MNKVSKIRAPHRVHILSWVLSLDSKGCIPCHYKNCNFMAMTLDEMVAHFHFSNCSTEFQFTCNICNLSTDLEVKLLFHRIYVHSYNATPEEQRAVFLFLGVKKEISANLRKGWQAYLENKGFLKCLNRACSYVPRSLDEMEEHYMYQCKANFWSILISECNACGGRFECGERMTIHAQTFHTSYSESVRNFKLKNSLEEHSPVWAKHILANKQANCPVPGCMFVSNNLVHLSKHYKICTGKKLMEYLVCYYCHCWLQNESKLLEHMKCLHKGLEIQRVTQPSCEEPSTEAQAQTQEKLNADEIGKEGDEARGTSSRQECRKYGSQRVKKSLPVASADVNIHPSPFSLNLSNNNQQIDCVGNDLSEIQYKEEDINTFAPEISLLDIPDPCTEELRNPLQAKKLVNMKYRKNKANRKNPQTSLEEVVSNLQEDKTTSSLPVQIKVNEQELTVTVDIPDQEKPHSSTKGPFPKTREEMFKVIREDSFKILKMVARKSNPRCDTVREFNPYEDNLLPVKLTVIKRSDTPMTQVDELAEDTDVHLLSNPVDESNPEDNTDINVKVTDSSPPSPSQIITLTKEVKLLPKIEPFEESVKTECFVDDVETSNSYIKPISQKSPCNKNLRKSKKLGIRFRRSKSLPTNIGKDVTNKKIDDVFVGFTTEDQSRSKNTILIEKYNKTISKFTEKNVDESSKNEKIGTRITRSKSLCCVNNENTDVPKQFLLEENGNVLQNFEVSQNPSVSGSPSSPLNFSITVDEDNVSTNSASFEDEQENCFTSEKTTCKEENIDTGENVTEKLVFNNDSIKELCYSSEDLSIPDVTSDPLDMSSSTGSDKDNNEDDIMRDASSVQSFPESQSQSIYNGDPQESSRIDDSYTSFKLFCDDSDHSDEYDLNKTYLGNTEEVILMYREKLKQSADSSNLNDMNEIIDQANHNKTGRPLTLYEKSKNIHKIYGKKKSIDESFETNIDTETIVNFSPLDGLDMSENRGNKSFSFNCDFSTNFDTLFCPESQLFINNKNDIDIIDDERYKKKLENKSYIKSPEHKNRDSGDFYKRFSKDYSTECSTSVSHNLGYSEISLAPQINTLDVTSIVEAKQEEDKTRTKNSLTVPKNKSKNTNKTSETPILFSNDEIKESRVMTRKRRFSESLKDITMNLGVNTTTLLNEPLEQSTNNQPKKRGRPKKSISSEGRLSVSYNEISQEISEVDINNKSVPEEEFTSDLRTSKKSIFNVTEQSDLVRSPSSLNNRIFQEKTSVESEATTAYEKKFIKENIVEANTIEASKKLGRPKKIISNKGEQSENTATLVGSPSSLKNGISQKKLSLESEATTSHEKKLKNENTVDANTLEVPKRRGRQKKSISNEFEQSEYSSSSKNGISQDKISAETKATTAHENMFKQENTPEVPKRRGRSKKCTTIEFEQSEHMSSLLGSPSSLENEISQEKTSVETEATTTNENKFKKEKTVDVNTIEALRKRGRSKKSMSNQREESEIKCILKGSPSSLENGISQEKKSVETEAKTAHENKFKMENTAEANTFEEPKRRGRSKKSISNKDEHSGNESFGRATSATLENVVSQKKTLLDTETTTDYGNVFKKENSSEVPQKQERLKKSISNENKEAENTFTKRFASSLENVVCHEKTSIETESTAVLNVVQTDLQIGVNSLVGPKKRGRPKNSLPNQIGLLSPDKALVEANSTDIKNVTSISVQKELGRPKTNISDVCNQSDKSTSESKDASLLDTSGIVMSENLLQTEMQIGVNSIVGPKKRGRPKKSLPNQIDLLSPDKTLVEANSSVTLDNENPDIKNVTSIAVQKELGRPKTNISDVCNKSDKSTSESKDASLLDTSGIVMSENLLQTEMQIGVNSIVVPKKRGRPKKSLPNQIDLLSPDKTLVEANSSVTLDIENPDIKNVTSISVQKELGRPKTNISDVCNKSDKSTSESKDASLLDTSGIVMSENLLQTEMQIGVNSIVGPKKRGRSKKSLPNQIDLLSPDKTLVEANSSVTLDNENPDIKNVTSIAVQKELGRPKTNISDVCNKSDKSISESKDASLLDTSGIVMSENLLQTEMQIGVNSIVGPKKRGRPKKSLPNQIDLLSPDKTLVEANSSVTLDNENPDIKNVTSIAVQKELGRPKTKISDVCNQSDNSTSESEVVSLLGTGCITKSENQIQTEFQDGVNSIVVPKKRGRPKKSISIESHAVISCSFESSKSSPIHANPIGKTPINIDSFSTDTLEEMKSVLLPRKRGRPKRVDFTADSSSVNTFSDNSNIFVEDEPYTLTKKQRPLQDIVETSRLEDNLGRSSALVTPSQRKEYSITVDNFPDEGFTPVPKKRGRPRKYLRDNEFKAMEAYSTTSSRRQGFKQEFDVSSDEEYIANKSCRRSLDTGSGFELSQEEQMKEVKCAVCGEDMTLHTFKYEHLIKHNFMSWIEGEEPLPLDDEDYMVNLLNRGKNQIPGFVFTCELCNETRKSAKGFLTHKQWCGKTDNDIDLNSSAASSSSRVQTKTENVKCAICEATMTTLQFKKSHLLKHNFMAWMEGEDPLPLNNVDYMANVLTRGKKCFPKFQFTCELCKKTRKSARGFLVHYQNCGREGMPASDFESSGYDIDLDEEDLPNPIEDSQTRPENLNSSQKIWKTSDLKNFLDNPEAYSSQEPPTDESGTPLTSRQIRMRILTGRIDCSTRLKYPKSEVTCAICMETMTARVYQRVHLIKHNFICWLIDEEPLPLDDVECMTNVLQRGKKKYPRINFTCEVCKEAKRSAHGFLSHRQFCGRSEEEKQNILQTCKYCSRLMMPFSLLQHMKQAHRDEPDIDTATVVDEPNVRKAAVKCLDKIADYVSSKQGDDMTIKEEEMEEGEYLGDRKELRAFYILAPRKPGKNLNLLWRKQEDNGELLQCSSSNCIFSCKTMKEMSAHFRDCQYIFSSFSCKKCNYMNRSEEDMMEHVREHCFDENWASEDDSHDVTMIPYLKAEENELLNRRKLHFFKPAVSWTKNAYDANFSKEGLFPEFEASWEEVTSSDSRHFVPEKKTSIPLRYNSTNWTSMNTFDGNILEGQKEGIGFTGGPIWGLAWCPSEGPQYLAVATQCSMETHFQIGSTYTGPGLIQIWGLGDINNSETGKLERLEYTFGICHEERGCWDLAWCPGGGQTASRLGLLAVATTSGTIPIYSVPQPDTLPLEKIRYYKLKPAIKLELPSNEKWQCSAISWSKKKPHRIFVAGFVNGVIAVWNLLSTSSLLKTTSGSLCAHKVFQAHTSFITGICLSPENEEFLASTSFDRSVKFWDLRDTTVSQTEITRGLATGIDWLRHWMMAATSFDAAYTMSNSTIGLSTIRGFMYQSAPVVSNVDSTSWDVSCNDWLNALAGAYDNGQLLISFATKHILQHKEKKKCSKVILQCSLHEVNPKEPTGEGCSATSSRQSEVSSTHYDQSAMKYGIEIKTDLKVQSMIKNDLLRENTEDGPIDIYPLASLNRVSWSPNRQSFTYIASGCQSGFLIVTKLSFPFSEQSVIDSAS